MRVLVSVLLIVNMLAAIAVEAAPQHVGRLAQVRDGANAIAGKLSQATRHAVAAVVIGCAGAGMMGCDGSQDIITSIVSDQLLGDAETDIVRSVSFFIGNLLQSGSWEITPEGLLRVSISDGARTVVTLDQISLVQADIIGIGARVSIPGTTPDGHQATYEGRITIILDDGSYLMRVDSVRVAADVNGEGETLLLSLESPLELVVRL